MGEEKRERKWVSSEAEELAEIMTAIGETVPKLIKDVIGAIVSEEAGRNLGRALGAFYKELIDAGIPPDEALKMTREHMASLMKISEMLPEILKRRRAQAGEEEGGQWAG